MNVVQSMASLALLIILSGALGIVAANLTDWLGGKIEDEEREDERG